MTTDRATLAALVGSRLCHDLSSPVGAIRAGLELIGLAGGADTSAEMQLIQESCDSATARIQLFRIAFGAAEEGQAVAAEELRTMLTAALGGGRLRTEWQIADPMPRSTVQLALLAVMCCETALPRGGTVTIARDQGGLRVAGTGQRIAVAEPLWSWLHTPGSLDGITPARVQFALLRTLADDRGKTLNHRICEDGVEITIA